jgi:hypothetical protein
MVAVGQSYVWTYRIKRMKTIDTFHNYNRLHGYHKVFVTEYIKEWNSSGEQ